MSALFSPITQNNVLWKHVFDASPAAVHFAFESSRRRCMSLLAKQCHYGVTKAKTGQKNKQVNKRTSASARRIPTNAGVQLKLFATPHPLFKVNISVSDWMLYLAYSKLLKPAEASNAGEYEKLAILDEYLVDHCQMRLRLITIWTTVLAYCTWSDDDDTCRSNKRRPLMNGTATHEWTLLYMTQVIESTSNTNCTKTFCPPPIWRPLKISSPSGKPHLWTELYHHANFHADRREISVPWQKYIFSL